MEYRFAMDKDLDLLAEWNHQLICDEGHRNPMTVPELRARMKGWLEGEYKAAIFEIEAEPAAYALYRENATEVYLRQLFVVRDRRRRGIGRTAVEILRDRLWPRQRRLTVEVLTANRLAVAFWRSVGYKDYCLALEILPKAQEEKDTPADPVLPPDAAVLNGLRYSKYHALGNDYIVLSPESLKHEPTPDIIRRICHRNYGIGSDGILYGPVPSVSCRFGLRIFNPDGSEAEKSGNGLRIFARSLYDKGLVDRRPFSVETPGGLVSCRVEREGRMVTVQMGKVGFDSRSIPVAGPFREVLNEDLCVHGRVFKFCAATVGNPHCVILTDKPSPEDARAYGPLIETDPRFPNRTNVQFLKVLDRKNIRIEIWERGAGYTLASGSSSTAAAAVAHKLGLCDSAITVHMPGGELNISFQDDFQATMTGPVTKVSEGIMSDEIFEKAFPEITLG